MKLIPRQFYHLYNRGIDRQPIFFDQENYLFFLKRFRTHVRPFCKPIAYCLMPNHFHFLIRTDERINEMVRVGNVVQNVVSAGVQRWLSGYAGAVNRQRNRTGSLFTQNTGAKELKTPLHTRTCFHYIHQNPLKAGLVSRLEDWEFSSFRDYAGLRQGTLCEQEIARSYLEINFERFDEESYAIIDEAVLKTIH
jgi:putative transposase